MSTIIKKINYNEELPYREVKERTLYYYYHTCTNTGMIVDDGGNVLFSWSDCVKGLNLSDAIFELLSDNNTVDDVSTEEWEKIEEIRSKSIIDLLGNK